MIVPDRLRVISYIDLQWWLRASKYAFDLQLPNINPMKLTQALATEHKWEVEMVRAYVDVPTVQSSTWWNQLWCNRIADLERDGVIVNATLQRTRTAWAVEGNDYQKVVVRSDMETPFHLIQDAVADVALNRCDVVVLFTRETKYLELVGYLKSLAKQQNRWLKIVSAFPYTEDSGRGQGGFNTHRGIERTDWLRIGYELNRECTDFIRKPVLLNPDHDHDHDHDHDFGNTNDDDSKTFSVNGGVTKTAAVNNDGDENNGSFEELSVDDIFEHSSVSDAEYEKYLRGEVEVNDSVPTEQMNSAVE